MKYFISINDMIHRFRDDEARKHYVSWLGEDEGNMAFNWGDKVYAPSTDRTFIWGEDITEEEIFKRALKNTKFIGYEYP